MDAQEIQSRAESLTRALQTFERLMQYRFTVIAGRKQMAVRTQVVFRPEQFCRLAGMQNVLDQYPYLLKEPEESFSLLLAFPALRRRLVQAQKWHLNLERVEALAGLEESLLHFQDFFLFDSAAALRERTSISADYILKYTDEQAGFWHCIFLKKENAGYYVPVAQFRRSRLSGQPDFTAHHTPCRLLLVTRTERATGMTEELFRNPRYLEKIRPENAGRACSGERE